MGEALIDLVADGTGAYQARPGGSPYNVAIGLSRLGVRTCLMARLADNAFGRQLRAHAESEGVDLRAAPRAGEPTTLAVVSLDDEAQATYDFYLEGTADWQWTPEEAARLPEETAVLHVGSIASWTAPGSEVIHELARSFQGLVSYDPNVRPLLLGSPARGRELVERTVGVAHLVKASSEDLAWLYPGEALDSVAGRWCQLGALLVVVTDGGNGAHVFQHGASGRHRPGRAVDVIDTVGAGDSFTAGLLSGLIGVPLADLDAARLDDLVDRAILASSITCTRAGADPPTAADLLATLGA
jgi:fructokinase